MKKSEQKGPVGHHQANQEINRFIMGTLEGEKRKIQTDYFKEMVAENIPDLKL
jgi:hypothetical protein